jgi:hypothetical protein
MPKTKFHINDEVITLVDAEPYYSGYAGNPVVTIPKGSIGIVKAVKCPFVRTKGYFNCVDFVVTDKFQGNPKFKNNVWRCSLTDKEIKK